MFGKLFLLFTILPVAELYVLLQIGEHIGGFTTFAMVVITGLIGAALARAEGLRVLRAWQDSVHNGRMPEGGVINGALVLLGCALLISPGVITDVFGLFLLFPPTRTLAARAVSHWLSRTIQRGALRVVTTSNTRIDPFDSRDPTVIDVTGVPVDPHHPDPPSLPNSKPRP